MERTGAAGAGVAPGAGPWRRGVDAAVDAEGDSADQWGYAALRWAGEEHMLYGRYAHSTERGLHETLLRLPGYPLFLALCFSCLHGELLWRGLCADALELADVCCWRRLCGALCRKE